MVLRPTDVERFDTLGDPVEIVGERRVGGCSGRAQLRAGEIWCDARRCAQLDAVRSRAESLLRPQGGERYQVIAGRMPSQREELRDGERDKGRVKRRERTLCGCCGRV